MSQQVWTSVADAVGSLAEAQYVVVAAADPVTATKALAELAAAGLTGSLTELNPRGVTGADPLTGGPDRAAFLRRIDDATTGFRGADLAALLDGLPAAIGGGQLELVYQPVVRLADGALTGLEALARWRHPDRGPIMPGDFIPIAERSGLILPFGRWMLAEVCREQGAGWPVTYVNTSAHQLREPGFAESLAALSIDPTRIIVEVTEDALAEQAVLDALRSVRELGVRIALDDFGAGRASLPALAAAPIDVIKLHGSMAEQIITSPRHATVARAVARLADELGIVAIAKAVESAAQAERLHELGYRQGMGFHIAVPQPASAVPLFFAAGESLLAALS